VRQLDAPGAGELAFAPGSNGYGFGLNQPFRLFSSPSCFLSGAEASAHFYQAIAFPTKFIPPNHGFLPCVSSTSV